MASKNRVIATHNEEMSVSFLVYLIMQRVGVKFGKQKVVPVEKLESVLSSGGYEFVAELSSGKEVIVQRTYSAEEIVKAFQIGLEQIN